MNKFALLLCFLLAVNYSICQDTEEIEKYYDYAVELLKGFSKNGQNTCANFFSVHRKQVISIVKAAIEEIKAGAQLTSLALKYVGQLLNLDSSVATTCNLFGILPLVNKFNSVDEIKAIGQRITSNAQTIYDNIQLAKNAEGLKSKLLYIGKILSIVLNFNVY